MKKKIGDLTDEEKEQICNKNHKKYGTCYDCPLKIDDYNCFKYVDSDREVEVEEDE